MFRFLYKRIVRAALHTFVSELYTFNERDGCYDPNGSVSRVAMLHLIDCVVEGTISPSTVPQNKLIRKKNGR